MKSTFRSLVVLGVLTAACLVAQAQQLPKVEGAWVRSTVSGQQGTGAFMKLTATEPVQLVGVSTPLAGVAEVHEMKLVGEVMRMRAVARLDLPAGQTVELKPGGYHLMLQDLKQPLPQGSTVPLTLRFRNAKGLESKLELNVPVALRPPVGSGSGPTKAGNAGGSAPNGHKH
jgi:periplasmic copper chaperone A